jgi:hypothetical protein
MNARRLLFVALVVVLAACGSSDKDSGSPGATDAPDDAKPQSTELGTGVTADAVTVGISLSDFDCIKPFVDDIRVDQEEVYDAFIAEVNENGGVAGRKIVPKYETFCPIPDPAKLAEICTKFTEDLKVFAVMGNYFDPTGNGQECIAGDHDTLLMVFMLTQAMIDSADPGRIIYAGTTTERLIDITMQLVKEQGTLEGKKVGVLGETVTKNVVEDSVEPGLDGLGVERGTTGILNISGADTTAAQSQLDSFIERWKDEGITALYMTGDQVTHKQFIEKIKNALPDLLLVTDTGGVLSYAQQEVQAGKSPNPYEGYISVGGPTGEEYEASENWKYCADIYKKRTGKDAPGPNDVVPGPDGKTLDTYGSINDACQLTTLFDTIGDKVGQYLNNDNWTNVVNSFGAITDPGGGQYASLHEGKYDIQDTFRLRAFDSTIPPQGDNKPLTELQNLPGS